jgi:hypothetical protein
VREYSVVRLTSGETLLCILHAYEEDGDIVVHFPLMVRVMTVPVAENVMREMHTTTAFCPFTDDKVFRFKRSTIVFVKPMNQSAVPYYVDMLNTQEEAELLESHGYPDLIRPDSMNDSINERANDLLSRMEEIEDDSSLEDASMPKGNRTLH